MPSLSTCATGRRPKAAGEGTRGEQGSPRNWRNAMKISAGPLVRERMDAWPEVCGETAFLAELRNGLPVEAALRFRNPAFLPTLPPQPQIERNPPRTSLNSVILRQSMANNGVNGKKQAD